ncbi:uncharacterized protein BDW70DRAFT_50507 [Aspergillus foveolatus]|uniref:uncharacterized protein n=1 Tax=Aspergillus foveolatus TaxID=210207 RepID=UPI003CCD78D3
MHMPTRVSLDHRTPNFPRSLCKRRVILHPSSWTRQSGITTPEQVSSFYGPAFASSNNTWFSWYSILIMLTVVVSIGYFKGGNINKRAWFDSLCFHNNGILPIAVLAESLH